MNKAKAIAIEVLKMAAAIVAAQVISALPPVQKGVAKLNAALTPKA